MNIDKLTVLLMLTRGWSRQDISHRTVIYSSDIDKISEELYEQGYINSEDEETKLAEEVLELFNDALSNIGQ